jgi:hypothetical protein
MVVEVSHVLGQHSLEVAAVEDRHPLQQFAADRSDQKARVKDLRVAARSRFVEIRTSMTY